MYMFYTVAFNSYFFIVFNFTCTMFATIMQLAKQFMADSSNLDKAILYGLNFRVTDRKIVDVAAVQDSSVGSRH